MREFELERDAAVIDELAASFEHALPAAVRFQLGSYLDAVASWNRKLNLTAAHGAQALCEVLLADAFVLAERALVPEGARVIDVGTGAGAPIVPLLVLRPDISALCLEPQRKRATFLRTLSPRLSLLGRMTVAESRLDPARTEGHETLLSAGGFDVACSRATFEKERWLLLGLALAPRVLVLTANSEPPQAPVGSQLLSTRSYSLPFSEAPRRIAVYLRGG